MQERLALAVERYDAGDITSDLNVIDSWVQYVRVLFDLMPAEGEQAAATVATRMAAVPKAYRQFSQTLLDAARNGRPLARLQVEEVAKQCAAWSTPEDSFYAGMVKRLTGIPHWLRGDLDAAAGEATAATARLGDFLRRELLPLAREKDACGPEVYALARGTSRRRRGSGGGLRLELGGDRPVAGRASAGRQPGQAGRHPGGGHRDPGRGPGAAHRGPGVLPRLDAGTPIAPSRSCTGPTSTSRSPRGGSRP